MVIKKVLLLMSIGAFFLMSPVFPDDEGENEQSSSHDENVIIDATDEEEKEESEEKQDTEEEASADENTEDTGQESEQTQEDDLKELTDTFRLGKYEEALKICDTLLKKYPENTKLLKLKGRIVAALKSINQLRKYIDSDIALNTVIKSSIVPETPNPLDRPTAVQVIELVSGMNRKQRELVKKRLNQKISLNVVDAELSYVLNLLFRGTGVNIIADPKVLEGKSLTIQVENIPLDGILNYISRLQGISYSISHATVWITTAEKPMLETRIIRLRSGLTDVLEDLGLAESTFKDGKGEGSSGPNRNAPSDLEKVLARINEIIDWPAGSSWVLDKKTNTLFVRSTSDSLDKFETIVSVIDTSPLQVLIEAKFIEISDGDLQDVGIEWQIANDARLRGDRHESIDLRTGSGTNFGSPNRPPGIIDFKHTTTGMDLFLTGVLTGPQFEAIIHAINTKDSSHTLSSPTLLTMNNFLGTIKVTTDLVYIESYTVDRSTTNTNNYYNTLGAQGNYYTVGDDDGDGIANEDPPDGIDNDGDGDIDEDGLPWDSPTSGQGATIGSEPVIIPVFATDFEGVILRVLPSIGIDGRIITLTLQPEVTELVGEKTFNLVIPNYEGTAEIVRPIMNRRAFVTKLSIKDGSTVVLGGLKREKDIKMVSRVPILGNIPLLGRLFSRTYTKKTTSNLLIFVTAHILEPSGSMYKQDAVPQKVVTLETPDGEILTREELYKLLGKTKE